MKMSNAEITDQIHKEIKTHSMVDLLKFIEEQSKVSVSDLLEKVIEEMNTELDARKDEPRPKRETQKKKKLSPRNSTK
jgi:TPP-dependent pyruvate/acetoin dehydrogenase alpha subunit